MKGLREIARWAEIGVCIAMQYHSWEPGMNENANGLLQRYLLMDTDFHDISAQAVALLCGTVKLPATIQPGMKSAS
jgi:IS30 family transposase